MKKRACSYYYPYIRVLEMWYFLVIIRFWNIVNIIQFMVMRFFLHHSTLNVDTNRSTVPAYCAALHTNDLQQDKEGGGRISHDHIRPRECPQMGKYASRMIAPELLTPLAKISALSPRSKAGIADF